MLGCAGAPDRIRFKMGPEKGLYQFKGETEAPRAMKVSLGVAWMFREAKDTDVQDQGPHTHGALPSALHLSETLFLQL